MAGSAHFRRACIIDLQAGLFGYTVAFTGSTLSAMISASFFRHYQLIDVGGA